MSLRVGPSSPDLPPVAPHLEQSAASTPIAEPEQSGEPLPNADLARLPVVPEGAMASALVQAQAHQPPVQSDLHVSPPVTIADRIAYLGDASRIPEVTQQIEEAQKRLAAATKNLAIQPQGFLRKLWNGLKALFTRAIPHFFADRAEKNTPIPQGVHPAPATPRSRPTPSPHYETNFTQKTHLLEGDRERETVKYDQATAEKFTRRGVEMGGDGISSYLPFIEKITARQAGVAFEYELSGMNPFSPSQSRPDAKSPVSHLQAEKIAYLQEQARQGKPALYAIPMIFPGMRFLGMPPRRDDHIVTALIDFQKKEIIFFDSNGVTIDQAQSAYSLPFSLRKALDEVGRACFETTSYVLRENGEKMQKNSYDCGRWISYFLKSAVQEAAKKPQGELLASMKQKGGPLSASRKTMAQFGGEAHNDLFNPELLKVVQEDYDAYEKAQLVKRASTTGQPSDVEDF